jgi:hypothetical protein
VSFIFFDAPHIRPMNMLAIPLNVPNPWWCNLTERIILPTKKQSQAGNRLVMRSGGVCSSACLHVCLNTFEQACDNGVWWRLLKMHASVFVTIFGQVKAASVCLPAVVYTLQ